MASAAILDRKVVRAVRDLHDFLWTGAKHDETALLRRLSEAADVLDAHLGTRAVSRGVRPLVRAFDRRTMGSDLFTFLWILGHLSVAVVRRAADPKEAARHASEVVSSNSIHLASASGRFDLVEMFEGGKTDFDAFQAGLAEVLEDRGVLAAEPMGRLAVGVYDLHATWKDDRPRDAARIGAASAIADAAFHSALLGEALRTLGRYRDAPYAQLPSALGKVVDGFGAQA